MATKILYKGPKEDLARENVLDDILEIMSVTLKASDLSIKNLKFIADHPQEAF